MVSGSRIEVAQVLSASTRKTIQSIKEIVGNHSDADIYVALKETNMDPNETTQKLLNQDPFHEVKRKRDRKKENSEYRSTVPTESLKNSQPAPVPGKYKSYSDHHNHNAGRPGFPRNVIPDAGGNREFCVVRDNRVNQIAVTELKPAQNSISTGETVISNGPMNRNSFRTSGYKKSPVERHSSQSINGPSDSQSRQIKETVRRNDMGVMRPEIESTGSRVQTKSNNNQQPSINSSSNSVFGLYSSSSDPVHVPSLHSGPAANVGTIRLEVGVVGSRRRSSDNFAKPASSQSTSLSNSQAVPGSHSQNSTRSFSSKSYQSSHNMAPESAVSRVSVNRSGSSNQFSIKPHQPVGHRKASQPNKEWKPKSSLKPSAEKPGAVGSPAKAASPPAGNPEDLRKDVVHMRDSISRLDISETQNVILAAHIRVSDTDRGRLTFGSLGSVDSSLNPVFTANDVADESPTESSISVSASVPEPSGSVPAGSKHLMDDSVQISGSNSPASNAVPDQVTENKNSSSPQNLESYADVGLVRDTSTSYSPESLQPQNTLELPSFSGYDPQMAYDMSYFHPVVDETVRGPGLPSSQEVLNSHTTNGLPPATIAMVQQQQQQQLAQMYPQLHVSQYTNLMPYRQFISPVYVPPMPVPGFSNNPAYPHPTNSSSYLLMPGNSSHLTPGGIKYGIQQFKPVPSGDPTGFGNFTSPTGYAISAPGVVGSIAGHEDSSRPKYKDSLYVPNPQAETSEIWMSPRDLSSVQSASYYNMAVQTPHTYLPSHSGHPSFNAAAAQSSHMQFPGMYHPTPQPAAIASPHHLAPAVGGSIGLGMAPPAPGVQAGAYQQPQLGHLNWTGNF